MRLISLKYWLVFATLAVFVFATNNASALDKPANNYYVIESEKIDTTANFDVALIKGKIVTTRFRPPIKWIAFQLSSKPNKDFRVAKIKKDGTYTLKLPANSEGVLYATTVKGVEIVLPSSQFINQSVTVVNFHSEDSDAQKLPDDPYEPSVVSPAVSYKPVVYVYSKKKVDLNIKLDYNGEFTFTYPKYENAGWNVQVDSNGLVCEGKKFPYLFWEGESKNIRFKKDENQQIPVFKVEKDSVVAFLEDKLTSLGLNTTERTDFITFWAPRLIQFRHTAIQFLIDDEYDERIAKMTTSMEPTNSRRIYILYTELTEENKSLFSEQITSEKTIKRDGLTIVEWGGTPIKRISKESL